MRSAEISDRIIERKAYMGERNLSKAILTSEVERIGEWAFANCNALEEVWIPETILCVSENSFFNCRELKQIVIYSEKNGNRQAVNEGMDAPALAMMAGIWPKDVDVFVSRLKEGKLFEELNDRLPAFLEEDDTSGFRPFLAGGEEDYDTKNAEEKYRLNRQFIKAKMIYECLLAEGAGYIFPQENKNMYLEWLRTHNPSAAFGVLLERTIHKEEYIKLYFENGLDVLADQEELIKMAGADTELKAKILTGRSKKIQTDTGDFFEQLTV